MQNQKTRPAPQGEFHADIQAIRARARKHIEEGAVTEDYGGNKEAVIQILNDALATETVCILRYRRHYFMAKGIHSESIKEEFLEHSKEEQQHADWISERIVQLGGAPDLNPETLSERSHSQYVAGQDLKDMIREDLIAERIAIESYREMIKFVAPFDPTTRKMLEEILKKEEEHADEMSDLLQTH